MPGATLEHFSPLRESAVRDPKIVFYRVAHVGSLGPAPAQPRGRKTPARLDRFGCTPATTVTGAANRVREVVAPLAALTSMNREKPSPANRLKQQWRG